MGQLAERARLRDAVDQKATKSQATTPAVTCNTSGLGVGAVRPLEGLRRLVTGRHQASDRRTRLYAETTTLGSIC